MMFTWLRSTGVIGYAKLHACPASPPEHQEGIPIIWITHEFLPSMLVFLPTYLLCYSTHKFHLLCHLDLRLGINYMYINFTSPQLIL